MFPKMSTWLSSFPFTITLFLLHTVPLAHVLLMLCPKAPRELKIYSRHMYTSVVVLVLKTSAGGEQL